MVPAAGTDDYPTDPTPMATVPQSLSITSATHIRVVASTVGPTDTQVDVRGL